ncbi:MAG TPA: acetyl-CoA hydrolase/transferase C-terminal domain-containing protein [Acidimicrobiales bacterium]|nr:acetyl-CoA hydrolase/transferase C-terminal domain-containing protein [Acidimicrobiales bacterium]
MRILTERLLESRLGALPWSSPRTVVSGNFATPRRLLELMDSAAETYRIFALNAQGGIPSRTGVVHETPFVGPAMRRSSSLDYLPMRLSLVPRLFDVGRPPDLVLLHTSSVHNGKVSLGIEVNILPAAIERARSRGGLVVAQVNHNMPYTHGDGELDLDAIDLAIEVEEEIPSPARRPIGDIGAQIGKGVADLIEDGATIQIGIGEIPDAVLASLADFRTLRIWSEAISDGVLELDRANVLDSGQSIVSTFLFGSPDLYSWVHLNERVRLLRTETVNDPSTIAIRPAMCSINTALQVDLHAQANASFVEGRIYSGFGGQPDFVVGALHSRGGHAIIALSSWHERSNTSTIVNQLAEPTTTFQHSAIVTEQGRADLFGRSERAQARLLIDATAHPRAKDSLRASLEDLW